MDRVAQLRPADRSDLFRAAADRKGVSPQIIEKDFWVCWVLRHLYGLPDTTPLCFKGGTSLSKAFAVIDRMSEDVDLVIDREALGFTGDRDPASRGLSGKARGRLITELKAEAAHFVERTLCPALHARFSEVLGDSPAWSLHADVSNLDNTFIEFQYPTNETPSGYLKPIILLELGARGDTWPTETRPIRPYAADHFPDQFAAPEHTVRVITAERTFWEKATLLHTLAHHEPAVVANRKPARHYYDLFRLLQREPGRKALADVQLLADVVRHKSTFYPRAADRYDLAMPATIRFVPPAETIRLIEPDYERMAEEMIFGDAPAFSEVLRTLVEAQESLRTRV